jgi:hypothetical protein
MTAAAIYYNAKNLLKERNEDVFIKNIVPALRTVTSDVAQSPHSLQKRKQ